MNSSTVQYDVRTRVEQMGRMFTTISTIKIKVNSNYLPKTLIFSNGALFSKFMECPIHNGKLKGLVRLRKNKILMFTTLQWIIFNCVVFYRKK